MGKILYRRDGNIGTVTISNRPKKNALTMDMLKSMKTIFQEVSGEGDLRCLVIRGDGDESFCAGYDIHAIPSRDEAGEQVLLSANPFDDMINAVETVKFPVISMLNGIAFGGGLELACAGDIRIASDRAVFGMTPAKLGIIYRPAGLMRFVNIIGVQFTKELFFTARLVSAVRAAEIGLVNRIVPPEELEQVVYETAKEISENAPLSIQGTKRLLRMCMEHWKMDEERVAEADALIRKCMESDDLVEGKRAFREKRAPRFRGS
ncbi:MAG: enoyl-CoA hydratase [Deltaproteobacteria bacterium]|nr:enoyl-CoA hydratase [Deltaproteobacteria bacterium]NIS76501.1 enoyl-CoA hydratase [Deltaproteobacteria bacterium]